MWGTPKVWWHGTKVLRFIPTGVGNAHLQFLRGNDPPVHPHGCGERFTLTHQARIVCGSSPRVWGTRRVLAGPRYDSRFIPTGVGNACCFDVVQRQLSVHPHGCGERITVPDKAGTLAGSSPRVWGTPLIGNVSAGSGRFIPTGVGNA